MQEITVDYAAGVDRYILTALPLTAGNITPTQLNNKKIVVIANDDAFSQNIIAQLTKQGADVALNTAINANTDIVISLLAWQSTSADIETAYDINLKNFQLAREIGNHIADSNKTFILVQNTGGDFGLTQSLTQQQAWLAGGSGLIKTAAHEWPNMQLKVIDLAADEQNADIITEKFLQEIALQRNEIEIGLKPDGSTITLTTKAQRDAGEFVSALTTDDVILVSGGARGVTAECLIELAKHCQAHFILLGRSALIDEPKNCAGLNTEAELKKVLFANAKTSGEKLDLKAINHLCKQILAAREIRQNLKTMQDHGATAEYIVGDVMNLEQLTKVAAEIRNKYGTITGIVHGAGVLADKLIKDKTDEQFRRVFSAKVTGLHNLLTITEQDNLKVIALFSSVAARFGNQGQCDYAMANEILNKIAQVEQHQRGKQCIVKSINWGPWEGGMVTPELKQHFAAQQIALLPIDVGSQSFVNELTHFAPQQVEIVIGAKFPDASSSSTAKDAAEKKLQVDQQTHAFLKDHSVAGAPVIPVCLVINWFMDYAKKYWLNAEIELFDIKVLQGIRLEHFNERADTFYIKEKSNGAETLLLYLLDEENNTRYQATARKKTTAFKKNIVTPIQKPLTWAFDIAQAYQDDILFHGPGFHVITELGAHDQHHAQAALQGVTHLVKLQPSWLGHHYYFDPAILDGGLQLALLFGYPIMGKTLPMSVATFVAQPTPEINEPITCWLEARSVTSLMGLYDLFFINKANQVIAQMQGVQMIKIPS
jgi:NAD(P)-dependent dehydrogenase (short-subunit alcohol dehydrogenase family)